MDGEQDVEAPAGVPGRAARWTQRVRRCRACGTDDLRAAFGLAVAVEDSSWRCRHCDATTWEPVVVDLPVETGEPTPCPYLDGAEP